MMDIAVEQKIRLRAYEIWMSAGIADGDAQTNWLEAERSVLNETAMPVAKRAAKPSSLKSMDGVVSGKPVVKKARTKVKTAPETAGRAPATKAPTASAAKPAAVRKRTKTQA